MLLLGQFSLEFLVAMMIVALFGMGLHEYAHAVVADYWGDPTPRSMGRLTPNPLVHINWVGWLMWVVLGFGILGSVPVNPARMRDPRWGGFWTAFAGPAANLLLALLSAIVLRVMFDPIQAFTLLFRGGVQSPLDFIQLVLIVSVYLNTSLFVFNLVPLFPLDGWRMMLALLPGDFLRREQVPDAIRKNARPLAQFLMHPAFKWRDWAQLSQFVLLALIVIGMVPGIPSPLGLILGQPTMFLMLRMLGA